MPLVNRTISNLFGGVSQQPAGIRLDNQCEELVNAYPSLADGLVKRPPSEFIAALIGAASVVLSAGDQRDVDVLWASDLTWVPTNCAGATGVEIYMKETGGDTPGAYNLMVTEGGGDTASTISALPNGDRTFYVSYVGVSAVSNEAVSAAGV